VRWLSREEAQAGGCSWLDRSRAGGVRGTK
jgi:hypothetical protein